MRTLITNGTIVTAEGSQAADVLIDGETIAADRRRPRGRRHDRRRDASTRRASTSSRAPSTSTPTWSCPSAGRSPRTPSRPGPGRPRSAGRPPIVDFAVQSRGKSLREGLDAWHAKAEGNAVADYGFHMIMSDVNDDTLAEMDALVAEGVPDFKLFTAYPGVFYSDDGAIFRAMQQTATNGGLIMMHAENGMAIDVVAAQTVEAGTTDPDRPRPRAQGRLRGRGHQPRHPPGRGRRRTGLHRPPVGPRGPGRGPGRARPRHRRPSPRPARSTCSCRSTTSATASRAPSSCARRRCARRITGTTSGRGLVKDDLQVVSTDHCPFDFHGQKELGRGDFRKVPNGLPGVEDRVDLMHDGGVVGGRISRERWVEIISTAPAKLFGMYPRKGSISVGADADLVVYDPKRKRTISATTHHMDVDYSCYEGRQVQGASDVVLSRGSRHRARRRVHRVARATADSSSARQPTTPACPEGVDHDRHRGRPVRACQRHLARLASAGRVLHRRLRMRVRPARARHPQRRSRCGNGPARCASDRRPPAAPRPGRPGRRSRSSPTTHSSQTPARRSPARAGATSHSRCPTYRPRSTRSWRRAAAASATSSPPGRPTGGASRGAIRPIPTATSSSCRHGRLPNQKRADGRGPPTAQHPGRPRAAGRTARGRSRRRAGLRGARGLHG